MITRIQQAVQTAVNQIHRRTGARRASVETLEPRALFSGNPTLFADPLPLPSDASFATADNAVAAFSLDQTFRLHSGRALQRSSTSTSTATPPPAPSGTVDRLFNSAAYSTDANPLFHDAELPSIQDIWQRVAEDFAPFDVDITTEDPGVERLRNTGGGDLQWGTRVVIGGNGWWYGAYGGVAYLNSFTWSSDTPCFVFSDNLGGTKNVAEATSHEIGHTMGLQHDGTAGTEYFPGHGSGTTGWAPMMGVGYYRNLSQWSRGEYSGATQIQDDLAVITSYNGFGYRTDDHGNSNASARALTLNGTNLSAGGVIERNTDVDAFSFVTGNGTVSLRIDPAAIGANLDVMAVLYNANGVEVACSNPRGAIDATFDLTLSAGTYYLHVDGVGDIRPLDASHSRALWSRFPVSTWWPSGENVTEVTSR
jgi:hypothetical protein